MYDIEEYDKAKTRVLKYIIYKKRTENEVRDKFKEEIDEKMLEDIIEYLKEAKYIDDYSYIKSAINNFILLKNLSIKELKYKLLMKGINKDLIEDYFYENKEELEEYEINSAINIIQKKNLEEFEIRNYLIKKGYRNDSIKLALDREEN